MKSSARPPPRQAYRSSESNAAPSGVSPSRSGCSNPYGNAERAENGLERRPPTLRRLADDPDPIRRRVGADEAEDLGGDELDGSTSSRSLEELHRALERFLESTPVAEELALEMSQRWRHGAMLDGRQLLDRTCGQRCQVAHRSLERGEGRSRRLVRDRDGHVRPRGERLDQRPLRTGQILEAVGEDGLPPPGSEIALDPLGRAAAEAVPIPETEPVELARGIRWRDDRARLRRRQDREARTRAPRPRTGARRRTHSSADDAPSVFERGARDRAPRRERALRIARDTTPFGISGDDLLEEIVERADAAGKQRRPASQEVALDALDVRSIGYDEPGIAFEHVEIAPEEQGDLAGMRRPDDERETHPSMVIPASDPLSYAPALLRKERETPVTVTRGDSHRCFASTRR